VQFPHGLEKNCYKTDSFQNVIDVYFFRISNLEYRNMRKIVVFGIGNMGHTISYYIEKWKIAEICGYTVDKEYINAKKFLNKPIVAFDDVVNHFPPEEFAAFVAMGYQDLNSIRTLKFNILKSLSYEMINVINPGLTTGLEAGSNCLVIPGHESLEPSVTLGDNVYIWGSSSVSHFVNIKSNTWISNGGIIGGKTEVGENCFIGLNVTINDNLKIGKNCLIGSASLVSKNLDDEAVVIQNSTTILPIKSDRAKTMLI